MDGTCWKEIAYHKNYVEINQSHEKRVGIFARWFNVDKKDRSLILHPVKCHGYIDLIQYKLSIPAPANNNDKFILSEKVFNEICSMLL